MYNYYYNVILRTGYIGAVLINSDTDNTITANGTDGVYFWGLQAEAGAYANFIRSYNYGKCNKNEDECSKSSATALIGQTEGVMFVDYVHKSLNHDKIILMIGNNSSSAIYFYVYGSTNNLLVDVINGGTGQASFSGITLVDGTRYKIAIGLRSK